MSNNSIKETVVKIKLIDILNSRDGLLKLANMKLDDKETILKLTDNIKKINPELFVFDETKKRLIEEYNKKIIEILDHEIDVDIQLISPEKVNGLNALEMMALEWLFEKGRRKYDDIL